MRYTCLSTFKDSFTCMPPNASSIHIVMLRTVTQTTVSLGETYIQFLITHNIILIYSSDIINCNPASFDWPCHQRANCVDEPIGSFTCTCRTGYTGNGFTCDGKIIKLCFAHVFVPCVFRFYRKRETFIYFQTHKNMFQNWVEPSFSRKFQNAWKSDDKLLSSVNI